MRKLSGLVLAGVLLLPVLQAQAAEVIHFQAKSTFVNALNFDPDGFGIGVFVSREEGNPAVYRIFYSVSLADGTFNLGTGLLPKGAFHVSAKSASLDVDVNDVTFDFLIGEIPANSVISVDWEAGAGERESGVTKQFFGGTTELIITGTRVTRPGDAAGTVFGAPFDATTAEIAQIHENTIIITR